MAKYTIELREVVDIKGLIFNFNYEFYGTEEQRLEFENKFIRHFYFREIGFETVDRFLWELQDKFLTVFPFYNTLFETATIEYTKTENYDMTEKTIITKKTEGKTDGVSSTVGQIFDNQDSTTESTGKVTATGKNTLNETGESETTATGSSETTATGSSETTATGSSETTTDESTSREFNGLTVDSGESSVSGNSEHSENEVVNKKFLDTPQGLVDLDNANYVTNMNKDRINKDGESSHVDTTTNLNNRTTTDGESGSKDSSTETETTNNSKTNTTDNSGTETENNSETTSERDVVENLTSNADSTDKSESTFKGEQRTTHDNNTRTSSKGYESETVEHFRHGNIGVQTATDMLEKHIDLQKKLSKIEKMFFDECEDLFMQIF